TLTYLSWATAWKLLKEEDENAKFENVFNLNPNWDLGEDTFLFRSGTGFMVRTKITFLSEEQECFLPIMDNYNNSIIEPDSRDVNDAIMRCLAKNVALFGIGLSIYNGEDLSKFVSEEEKLRDEFITKIKNKCKANKDAMDYVTNESKLVGKKLAEMEATELKELLKNI
ncbi:MAG: DUF1071 domain-containing protein, partial [Fusobacteriaceae bacterium]